MADVSVGFVKVPVSNVVRAAAFYRDGLGLTEDFVVADYGWAQLSSASIPICLYVPGKGGGERAPGGDTGIQLRVADASAVHGRLAADGNVDGDLSTGDDGTIAFLARDPDGNLIQVTQVTQVTQVGSTVITTTRGSTRTTFLVTGANRGIGLELTRQALARGDAVLATCRRPDAAQDLDALRGDHPETLEIHALDVTSDASVGALVAALDERSIDVLVNNAGIYGGDAQTIGDTDFGAWADVLAVNTVAPFRVTTALLPALRRSARPRVLTISSEMGSLVGEGTGAYAYRSSKAAVNKVMQVLAEELRGDGIVVVPAHPGWVSTDMGGPDAPVTPEESARGLLALADLVTMDDSGRFLAWTGDELPW